MVGEKIREGYKSSELGIIPNDWEVTELVNVINYIKGYAFKSSKYTQSGIRIIRVSDTDYDSIKDSDAIYIDINASNNFTKWKLEEYDVIVSTVGSKPPMYDSMVGKAIIVNAKHTGSLLNQNAVKINSNNGKMESQLLLYYNLKTKRYLNYIEKIFRGNANQASITLSDLFRYKISLPKDINEQKGLADALYNVDNLLQSLEKLIDKKKKIKQGTMQQLLTGKKRLPGFSGEWKIKKLGDISDIRTGKKNNDDKSNDGIYPFFVRSKTIEKINSYSFDGEAILIPGEGGIGSIYHYINGKFDYHQRVYKISNFDGILGKYIYYFMKQNFSTYAMRNTVKATVDSLRLPTFEEFEIHYPNSTEEQKLIANVLTDMDSEIEALEQKLEKYTKIKQGMMQELLTGRIRLI